MSDPAEPELGGRAYRKRLDRFSRAAEREGRRSLRISRIRTATFLAGVALLVGADLAGGRAAGLLLAAGLVALALMLVYVRRHRRAREEERRLREMAALNEVALARLRRDWRELPTPPALAADRTHPYDADLAVTGPRSLLALCTDVATRPGLDTLRAWLLAPGRAGEIPSRQEAVAELAPMLDFRQELAEIGRRSGGPSAGPVDGLVAWAEEDAGPELPAWLAWASWTLPPVSLGLLAAHLAGLVAAPWWLLPLLAAGLATRRHSGGIHARMERIGSGSERIGRFGALLRHVSTLEAEAPLLRGVREAVRGQGGDARTELRRLERRVAWAEVRRNDLMYAPLQLFLLWDLHVLRALEAWRRRVGPRVRPWLDALGTLEALCALVTLGADHPDWCFAQVRPGLDRVEAEALGHPLLPDEGCVRNDVELGPPGTFLFVTGSNMAGKSTLLRALGANVVLARAGAPSCARSLEMPPLRVRTSMRVEESLSEGVSYFMAELRRIRGVVEAARRTDPGDGNGERVLYLLDEPLQGTNEAERRVAMQTILRHLLRSPALGAVATHDLRLHAAELLDEAARPVHLEGTVEEGEEDPVLSFDYRVRPGLATSSNALALLRAVGLGEEGAHGA